MIADLTAAGWTIKPPRPTDQQADRILADIEHQQRHQTLTLSPAETWALQRAADGMTMDETAAAADRSLQTIMSQIGSARAKLAARNVAHAVAIALRHHLIH